MPADEYAPVVRGGLKLKGSKPAGITKKKKKAKPKESEAAKSTLQKALEDEDASTSNDNRVAKDGDEGEDGNGMSEAQLKELESRGGDGKTASERQYEETRRKRVSYNLHVVYFLLCL
jgi:protein FAM32A